MTRHTYRIDIAYDGGAFAGFAKQPGLRTVEGQLLEAWRPLLPGLPNVRCGGRTDRGVHALRQTTSIWARHALDTDELEQRADEAFADSGWVLAVSEVPRAFHARFSALARHYIYLIDALPPEQIALLDAMLGALVGERCLSAFARGTPAGTRTVRRLLVCGARPMLDGRVRVDVIGRGFMKRQVRVTVATALREVARQRDAGALVRLAEAGERRATEPPGDAGQLYLAQIVYPDDLASPQLQSLLGASAVHLGS